MDTGIPFVIAILLSGTSSISSPNLTIHNCRIVWAEICWKVVLGGSVASL